MNIEYNTNNSFTFRRILAALFFSLFPVMQASALDIINESTRGFVGTGQDKMVIGFIGEGAGNQQFILFGVGPTLGDFGLNGVLQNPKITLFNNATGAIVDSNDNWKEHPSSALVNEFMKETGMTLDDREAAMVIEIPEGSYTLEVEGVGGTTGTGLGGVQKTDLKAPEPPPGTDPGNVCSRELCATNDALAQECQSFLDNCLKVEDEDECVGGALLICSNI